ncbi:MAG: Smr/MutS family protein [Deltaproteobacteria bacterium]|nr:Smr/MutS family protein [Deltaproteobacteria bacterium]
MKHPPALQRSIDSLVDHFGFHHTITGVSDKLAAPTITHLFERPTDAVDRGVNGLVQRIFVVELHAMRALAARKELNRLTAEQPHLAVIYHGKGTGVLREVVDAYLADHPSFIFLAHAGNHPDRPAPGATICIHKDCLSQLTDLYRRAERNLPTPKPAAPKKSTAKPQKAAAKKSAARAQRAARPKSSLDALWLTGKWLLALAALAIALPWAINLLLWLYQLVNAP